MTQAYTPNFDEPLMIGATGMAAICQNIKIILLTLRYSVPLDRAFAHDGKLIDSPAPQKTARLAGELIDAIEKYEPRVKVESIDFEKADQDAMNGIMRPKVVFHLKDGVKL